MRVSADRSPIYKTALRLRPRIDVRLAMPYRVLMPAVQSSSKTGRAKLKRERAAPWSLPSPSLQIDTRWSLTPAEARVVDGLARGLRLAEIAAEHHLSVHTVRSQLKRAMAKIGVHSQIALVARVKSTRR